MRLFSTCAKVQGHAELERYKGVLIVWHCAKVQGHAELEIEEGGRTVSPVLIFIHRLQGLCNVIYVNQD